MLVDCFAANYENLGNKVQLGLATIRLQVADIKLSNSSGAAPAGQKTNNNRFRLLIKDIYKALHGWAGHDHYSALIRTREGRVRRNDGTRVQEVFFTVQIKDILAKKATITASPGSFNAAITAEIL